MSADNPFAYDPSDHPWYSDDGSTRQCASCGYVLSGEVCTVCMERDATVPCRACGTPVPASSASPYCTGAECRQLRNEKVRVAAEAKKQERLERQEQVQLSLPKICIRCEQPFQHPVDVQRIA